MFITCKVARWTSIWLLSFTALLLGACGQNPPPANAQYLYIAHTRLPHFMSNRVIPEVEQIAFDAYDLLLLGGDLTFQSSIDQMQVDYLDAVFSLSSPKTLLSFGNHEYDMEPQLLLQKTGRSSYFRHQQNGITWLVFDTQLDSCRVRGEQWALFERSLEQMGESRHLVLLFHHLVWLVDGGDLEAKHRGISNAPLGSCSFCLKSNNFYDDLYPRLVELQKKGIQVICVSGDMGNYRSSYEHQTKEGIVFLGEGLKYEAKGNKALVFHHQIDSQQLSWTFVPLDQLPKVPTSED
ncbi:MAG: hypothetical protein AAFP19_00550 [Bacteroidota bacterium]